jgi:anionic cell wall polymer biosynthesis LytR-Cps2A-Psr (LCP) family protein
MIRSRKIDTISHATDIQGDTIPENEEIIVKKWGTVFMIRSAIFLVWCLVIWWAWWSFYSFFSSAGKVVSTTTRSFFSRAIGTSPILDQQWNLNVALLWYGWWSHDGTYLTDAIIIASINPKKWTMSMLSIPRDLYIKKKLGNYGKINSLYESSSSARSSW